MLTPVARIVEDRPGGEPADRALALLRRFGWNATSFQSLEPGFRYWFTDDGEGVVAYVDTGAAWIAAGAPIAAPLRLGEVAERFIAAGRSADRRIGFFAVEERFLAAAVVASVPIGEQPVWNPVNWDRTLGSSRSLREQLRRAHAKGVGVRAIGPDVLGNRGHPDRRAIEGLIRRWLGRRRLAPMGFLVQVDPFAFATERRLFLAERAGRAVGFLGLVPIYARGGWLFEDLLREPDSPNGTAEILIDAAMRAIAAEGSRFATLGLAPLAGPVGPWLATARTIGRGLYNFEGLRAFKARLRPDRWDPIYVCYPPGQSRAATVYDAVTAFAPGGLLRFAFRSIGRRPQPPIRILTALLIPWTYLLYAVAPAGWFANPTIRLAWTLFDLTLLAAMVRLTVRWRRGLARALAVAITADAVLTLIEVATFNASHAASRTEIVAAAIAVVGPTLTAAFLWAALGRTGDDHPAIDPPIH